ncbi:MAG: type VI secretion system baseplate subunit TssG [bacterium]|nr:MAG: type VI secretion system baseplate subunit TssG [bacterium]
MGTESGQNFTGIIKELEKNAPRYSIFQAIYIAEKISKKLHPKREEEKLEQKGLKFRPHEMYVYPPTDIREFSFVNDEMRFVINFMGLYGVNSPLPRCYHDQVAMQQAVHGAGSVPLQNFLDIFNNRFYWLYYNAWKKYRLFLDMGENFQSKNAQRLFAFNGVGPHLESFQSKVSPFKLLQLSGILSLRIRNKAGLRIMLKEFFAGCEIRIKEFVANQVKLSELPQLGKNGMTLGINSILGKSVTDYLSKICIQIGPMQFDEYLKFLPGGGQSLLLKELVEIYLNDNIEFDVEFIVNTEDMESLKWGDTRLRLGQSIWLGKPKHKFVRIKLSYEELMKVA